MGINNLITRSEKREFVIIDGKRALIPSDSTKYLFEFINISFEDLENKFKNLIIVLKL